LRRVAAAFLVSCGPILRLVTKAPVQTIVRLILSLALALAPALAHSGEMKPQFDHEKHQWCELKNRRRARHVFVA